MKIYNFYNKYYKMKKLTKIEILYFFNQNIPHCHYPCFVFRMDTLLFGNYNPEKDTEAIQNIGASEHTQKHTQKQTQKVYQPAQYVAPFFPEQLPQPQVFVPCKNFKNVVGQNTGASNVHFWAVIETVLTVLNLSPDMQTQYRAFADSEYRKKNPNA